MSPRHQINIRISRRKLKTKLTSPSDHKCARHVGKIHSVLVKGTKVNAYPDLYIDAAISSSSTALSTQRCSAIHAARSVFPFLEIRLNFFREMHLTYSTADWADLSDAEPIP